MISISQMKSGDRSIFRSVYLKERFLPALRAKREEMTVFSLTVLIECARQREKYKKCVRNRGENKLDEESGCVPREGSVIVASNC